MTDLISRQTAIREYQKVCEGIKCGECPFLSKVNIEKGSHLITDCKLEAFLRDLPPEQPERYPIDKTAMMWEIYMEGVNMGGEYQGCWVRFKNIEKIVDKYMAKSKEG